MICRALLGVHVSCRGSRRRSTRCRVLLVEETNSFDPQEPGERFADGSCGGSQDFEDGDSEASDGSGGKRTGRTILPAWRTRSSAGVLCAQRRIPQPLPRGIHAHDALRVAFHRGKNRTRRNRSALAPAGPGGLGRESQSRAGRQLKERVSELVKIRDEGGYMAELGHAGRNVVEMLEHNCPIMAVAESYPEACRVEREMFQNLLGADLETSHRVVAGDTVCRFLARGRAKGHGYWHGLCT